MPYEITNNFNVEQTSTLKPAMSFANGVSFRLAIDKLKYPNVEYAVQTIALPDISMAGTQNFRAPQRNIAMTPDSITYNPFELTFLVDEYLTNYIEIHDWMLGLVTQDDATNQGKFRDMTLQIMSSHSNVAKEIKFVNAFPVNLSSLPFDTTITDTNYLVASVTFEYHYFKFL